MNDDEWIYQEDDFNEDLPFVELQFGLMTCTYYMNV